MCDNPIIDSDDGNYYSGLADPGVVRSEAVEERSPCNQSGASGLPRTESDVFANHVNRPNPVSLLLMALLLISLSCFSDVVLAQVNDGGAAAMPPLSTDFGAVGLIGEMNSAEHYGAVQSRLGAYSASGTGDGHLDTFVSPSNVILSLGQGGKWFTKLAAVYVNTDGTYPGGDSRESTSGNFLLQLLHRPAAGTLIGLGVMPDKTDIAIPVNDANIDARSGGVRFDLLQRLGTQSGLEAKLIYLEGHSTFSKPLPNGQMLSSRSSTTRTYVEATFTTILDRAKFAFIPNGWSLRPVTHILFQRDHDRSEQGSASTEDFAQWLLTARLQKDVFRAGQVGPYVELGTELELVNDAAAGDNNEFLFYGKAGAAFLAGNWGRLDAYYARRQAPDGEFSSNTVNLLLSMIF